MKAKFGAIIVAGSGKIGGHVASKNRSGAYIRTKVTPVNPQTSYQQGQRTDFTSLAQGWRALTQAQRDAWNAAVDGFKRTDVFGDLKTPSGFNLYMRLNGNILAVGKTVISTPPLPSDVSAFTSISLAADFSDTSLDLTFAPAIAVGTSVQLFASPALSAGKAFVKSELRLIDTLISTDVSPVDIAAAWQAKFGSFPAAGSKIFVAVKQVDDITGLTGALLKVSAIVVA